jgi:hypothetical protein
VSGKIARKSFVGSKPESWQRPADARPEWCDWHDEPAIGRLVFAGGSPGPAGCCEVCSRSADKVDAITFEPYGGAK